MFAPARLRAPAAAGEELRLLVGVGPYRDPWTVLTTLAERVGHRFDTLEHPVHLVGVERLVEVRGVRQIPGVHEHVTEDEHADGVLERVAARVLVEELPRRRLRIVQQGLKRAVQSLPRTDGVDVDRRKRRHLDAGATREEPWHPLD